MAAGVEYMLIAAMILGILVSDAECVGTHRLCGKELADALALVCQGRGYNAAFKPQGDHRGGRYKRGIVDECCRRGCPLKTLESYCSDSIPTKKDTLQISKRSELSSSEVQTTVSIGRRPDDRQLLDNTIRSSKNRKLRPLVLLYSNRYQTDDPKDRISNSDINSFKNPYDGLKTGNEQFEGIPVNGYSSENLHLDTSEIMAEVVDSSPTSTFRRKQNLISKLAQV